MAKGIDTRGALPGPTDDVSEALAAPRELDTATTAGCVSSMLGVWWTTRTAGVAEGMCGEPLEAACGETRSTRILFSSDLRSTSDATKYESKAHRNVRMDAANQ